MSRCVSALNLIAAAFHGVQAITVFALISWLDTQPRSGMLFNGGRFELVRVVPVWRESTIESVVTDSGRVDVLYVIFAFFLLSAVFQCAGGFVPPQWAPRLRFVEYSFSASIMMMAIALEAGIRDLYTLECMFVLTWATQVFGLMADAVSGYAVRLQCGSNGDLWLWVLPHVAGWATCLAAYAPAIDVFLQSRDRSDRQPPSFVTALIFAELVMFSCFGAVQTYGLIAKTLLCRGSNYQMIDMSGIDISMEYDRTPLKNQKSKMDQVRDVDATCEYAYIILSLVAKTMLCWIVLAPLLTDRMNQK
jgi:hypothetical protein